MVPHQMLMEMLDREALVALAIKPLHFLGPVRRDTLARRLAEPPVDEAGLAFLLISPRPAPQRPLAYAQKLRRLLLVQLRRFASGEVASKTSPCAQPLGLPSGASTPPKRAGLTGQIVRYLNRTYRVLATHPGQGNEFRLTGHELEHFGEVVRVP